MSYTHCKLKWQLIINCPHKSTRKFSVCFVLLTHVFWKTFQNVTHLIIVPSQTHLTVEFLCDRLSKNI
ncbi:hypothetical protein JHK82_050337 [Glycine max]|uniref:Uncharacterized protein n=1 Tax=Glycine max TaxID=3847 RepID=A0A0R0FBU4_SOYBN|nr:hypothetical protein JHK86_050184 [Glycine max]KAG4936055.1 hypothetical protein JHK85_050974 [Glycine max]KAG5091559.1 hypothetical protein JHK82_050337 [Glycine max]KAG5094652.1 hypothetical protein JHK84_050240 [Glycine max]KAH1154490.1 hypothetical protein GYH30_049963 [Glycine max]